jgi:putative transposase
MSTNPFRYFKTSPEIIRLAVMLYIRFPLSLRTAALAAWRELSAA